MEDQLFDIWRRSHEFIGWGYDIRGSLTEAEAEELITLAGPVNFGATLDLYDHAGRLRREHGFDLSIGYELRRRACRRFAFAITSPPVTRQLAELGPLVEIGAGTGWWAHQITEAGGDIVAYDLAPCTLPDERWNGYFNPYHGFAPAWHPVRWGTTAHAADHPDRTLLLVWPPYATPVGYNAVRFHHDAGGQRVAFIGEDEGGCTGDATMFEFLEAHYERADERADDVGMPQWFGINDRLIIFERV